MVRLPVVGGTSSVGLGLGGTVRFPFNLIGSRVVVPPLVQRAAPSKVTEGFILSVTEATVVLALNGSAAAVVRTRWLGLPLNKLRLGLPVAGMARFLMGK